MWLAVALSSHINIGLRHILPMYVGLAVLGGGAAAEALRGSRRNAALGGVLLAWMAAAIAGGWGSWTLIPS